ncbi:prolipoprotein diacylglyceryl transferase family protein [Hymenobacter edaphi]|uniref:Phosphatidylglycerol:prolipoprotein diacylglycerol transferase n=1 Tax=Hymenobacter edaphi TaxID=2211146 RepID=A0A328BQM6_9BACT|nr:prolipoprotein diacylglyceryl transferase family protein [Hymenobacter edaphi]RAK69393.1 hypothetical protein DLM85_00575 [Hymenobacter edaphi]
MPHLSPLLLPSPVGHQYYTTFYVLAVLLNQALLLWVGHRRGYPLRSWLLLTTGVTLAFIVGTKLIAVPGPDWAALWQPGQWPAGTARSVLGGAIGAALAGLALRRWLGYGWHALDAFCLPTAAAYAVQCVGCLLTGCCFGHVAAWGVTYAPDTLPYLVQVQRGLIPATAAHSLPVLPTQALAGLLVLGVGGLLWALRRRPWPGGSWRLLQVALLLLGRFLLEFGRDPAGEQVGAGLLSVGGLALKQVQWVLLPLLLLFGWGWWRRTRATAPAAEVVPANQSLRILLGVAAMLALTALLGPAAFTLPEVLVLKAGLTVVLLAEALALLRRRAEAGPHRLSLPLGLASVVLLFTNQAPAPTDSAAVRRYLTLGVGGTGGAYDQQHIESGCSGSSSRTAYYHRYRVAGGTVEYTVQNPRRAFRALGVGVWRGAEDIGIRQLAPNGPFATGNPDYVLHRRLWDINPYIEYRYPDGGNWSLGFRAGLHLGQLGYADQALRREASGGRPRPMQVLPEASLWTGVRRLAYLQADFGTGPLALGNYVYRLGVGSGLGATDGGHLLAGFALASHYPRPVMGFVSGQLRLGRTGLLLEPSAATDFGRHYQLSGQLRYALPLAGRR